MTLRRLLVIVFIATFSSFAFANQDDAKILLRRPQFLFSGAEEGKTLFLSTAAPRGGFGWFFASDEYHSWRFGVGLDMALVTFGERSLFRFGTNFDGIADARNEIGFRIGQAHYEVFSAYDLKIDESVIYLGYRHRCRHGVKSTPDNAFSRIIMKTGPEVGFNGLFHAGPVDIITATSLLGYLYGQNDDLTHQHRANLSATVQAEIYPFESIGFFASTGISAIWVTTSDDWEYNVFTTPLNSHFRISPGASGGINFLGTKGDLKTFISYNSNLDTGFREKAQQIHILSVNGEFWF